MDDRVTLHEELLAILESYDNRWMSLDELAAAVNERGRYHKTDGSAVAPGQVQLRTRTGGSYDHLFEREGKLVRARRRTAGSASVPTAPSRVTVTPTAAAPTTTDVATALEALGAPMSLQEARVALPSRPGLYAIHGKAAVWVELGLGVPPDVRPLYVGKAETSVADRDLRQHFETGRTGSSTLRRSLAALLAPTNSLRACPRNPAKPSHFANYGLEPASDAWLTNWMLSNLELAVWIPPAPVDLRSVEHRVLAQLQPPLNLDGIVTRWTQHVSAARRALADMARRWPGDS